ncbi:MAG TPA: symmetrical bis(5'-nucleosyl)-tetraphosphatase [Kofleriaceae bacterium]|nr:symmetrical bis(5'-nucleosyl)-tetraphosphatase [Kofleriaceae bacterium]
MALYVIGDIQGCMASLERLLSLFDFSPQSDRLWLVGDLVNRGPRSLDVLRWAYEHDDVITCVLGNHDIHLLARYAGAAPEKKRDTLDDILNARDAGKLIDWLRARPLLHVDAGSRRAPTSPGAPSVARVAMVHAGLHPEWTIDDARARAGEIETQLRAPTWRAFLAQLKGSAPRWKPSLGGGDRWRAILAYLTRARMLKADGRADDDFNGAPKDAPSDLTPWFKFPNAAWQTHTVVFGHWAALGLDLGPHHIALDTGCVWGKSLTAFRLDDRSAFQAKAVEPPRNE